jgi:hypothetical protein
VAVRAGWAHCWAAHGAPGRGCWARGRLGLAAGLRQLIRHPAHVNEASRSCEAILDDTLIMQARPTKGMHAPTTHITESEQHFLEQWQLAH